ncbi:uncharacterized protein MELLADRAFT_95837 [Melampsora larici-populina 98AG31]|uniref:Uncharacterized protein n=1 Tax=Melampsora larici-populina (strain 98AG31 / pathotype 3-4-7) TaxID=747676 RepID=F4RDF1_MELLP|nr:uncharacterized protein MELLADRAFT_95837 [Melampsora larici-populina 98AG31]EGG09391.1 hypothetical protein MELLADRAFT_95837 [Melampsora larici-populina 98AG31]
MEARIAQAEARLTRSTSQATGVEPGPSLVQQKRTLKRKHPDEDIQEEESEEEDDMLLITGGNIDGEEIQPEVLNGRGSSDTERDGSWRPPPTPKNKGKGRRTQSSSEDDLDGEDISSLGRLDATQCGARMVGRAAPATNWERHVHSQRGEAYKLTTHDEHINESRYTGNQRQILTSAISFLEIAEGDRAIIMQSQIEELYSSNNAVDRAEGARILAEFMQMFAPSVPTLLERGQSRNASAGPSRLLTARRVSPLPNHQQSRQPSHRQLAAAGPQPPPLPPQQPLPALDQQRRQDPITGQIGHQVLSGTDLGERGYPAREETNRFTRTVTRQETVPHHQRRNPRDDSSLDSSPSGRGRSPSPRQQSPRRRSPKPRGRSQRRKGGSSSPRNKEELEDPQRSRSPTRLRDKRQLRRSPPAPRRLIKEESLDESSIGGDRRRMVQAPIIPIQTPRIEAEPPTSGGVNSEEEEGLAKALLESGKGRMVLSNGDVIENGRRILCDESVQMLKGLTQLSPMLQVYL